MSNIFGGTFVKEGQKSLERDADDLYDKIINLKFLCGGKGGPNGTPRTFTIRSDWEAVHHKDGTTSFEVCTQKPDIKVEYKQVADSVAIEVNIYVTNYFMGDGDTLGDDSIFTHGGEAVQWCTIQMGYRGQFPKPRNMDEYYALASEKDLQRGKQIRAMILTAYPQSFPPDRVVYFQGIIGNMETGFRWQHTEADLVPGYGDPHFPEKLSEIGGSLFQLVTRRFIRPIIYHNTKPTEKQTDKEIYVFEDEKWKKITPLESGILSIEDAEKYGILCHLSKTLQELKPNALFSYGATPEQAENMKLIPPAQFNVQENKVGGQLTAFQQAYPFLRWYELMDGSYYFYHVKESDEDLWSDPYVKDMQNEGKGVVPLPAIYDMTPAGTRNIRCPFVSFISPMTTLLFQSRYIVGTLVSYFYPPKTNAFLAIISDVKFATVQDDNIMDIMCVDLPPKEVVYENGAIKVRKRPTEVKINNKKTFLTPKDLEWEKVTLTVTEIASIREPTHVPPSWVYIANKVFSTKDEDRWTNGTTITLKKALEYLVEWNQTYFNDGAIMARGNNPENNDVFIASTGIKVPVLEPGDKIITKSPFQSHYPNEAEKRK